MNRVEFIKQLEYLLQDIPEEDREDAVAYYRDYLDDAGDDGEEQAIREFGSPERVAAIIRSDLNGSLEEGGEFTDAGYQDERFRDPNYQMVKRMDLPEVGENYHGEARKHDGKGEDRCRDDRSYRDAGGNDSRQSGRKAKHQQDYEDRSWFKRLLKVGLLLVVLGIAAPIIFGVGGGALGVLAAVICLVAVAFIGIGLLTIAACIGAVVLLVIGIGMLLARPAAGVLVLGGGVLVLGLALIGIALSILIYGKWIPAMIRWIVNSISNLFHRGRRHA